MGVLSALTLVVSAALTSGRGEHRSGEVTTNQKYNFMLRVKAGAAEGQA